MMMPTSGSIKVKSSPGNRKRQTLGGSAVKGNAAHKCQLPDVLGGTTNCSMTSFDSDRIAITELVAAYGDAVSRRDAAAWGATWAEDATWSLMGHEVAGRAAIVALWQGAMSQFDAVSFLTGMGPIRLNGDRASVRCQTQEVLRTTEGSVRRVAGIYDDEFVRVDGHWCFARRVFAILIEH